MQKKSKTSPKTAAKSRWTGKQERLLRKLIRESKNAKTAFAEFEKQTGRSASSAGAHYYAMQKNKKINRTIKRKSIMKPLKSLNVQFSFQIDNDWKPSKIYNLESDPFLAALEKTTSILKPGQSFPVNFAELSRRYKWKEQTGSTALRHFLKKSLDPDVYNRIKLHEVRDMEKNLVQIRIRRMEEA